MRTKPVNYSNEIPDSINCSPESNFTPIPNDIIRNPNISSKAKIILFILLSNQQGWKSHIETILGMIKEGVATVNVSLQELEQLGYLKRVQYRDRRTKTRAGSFWAYSNTPYNLDYSKNISIIEAKGFELYPEKLNVEKLNVEKLNVEKLNTALLDIENKGLIILSNNNTKKKENQNKKNQIKKSLSEEEEKEKKLSLNDFNRFWKVYPKKDKKGEALKSWTTLSVKKDRPTLKTIMFAVRDQKQTERWSDPQFIPMATTWINQTRWIDDPKEMKLFKRQEQEKPHPNTIGYREPNKKYREADRHV
jgi:hypothetical protein